MSNNNNLLSKSKFYLHRNNSKSPILYWITHVFCQNGGWHFILQFYDLFLRTEYHTGGLNLLLGNDSHLFMIFKTSSIGFNMPIKDAKRISIMQGPMQGNILRISSKTAKQIFDIGGTSVF